MLAYNSRREEITGTKATILKIVLGSIPVRMVFVAQK
jgi:hypothetical protein